MAKVEEEHVKSQWHPLNPQFTQSKQLGFNAGSVRFWEQQQLESPAEIFKTLFPKKLVGAISENLNNRLREMFGSQTDDKNLKKKLYKPEQIHEFFAVKILMGYQRMPQPEDYFNSKLPFQSQIGTFIKEGRFKCVESWTNFSDEILKKKDFLDAQQLIPRIVKKINKIAQKSHSASQNLVLLRIPLYEQEQSLILMDAVTQYILAIGFTRNPLLLLRPFQGKNHKVYFDAGVMNLQHITACVQKQIYPVGAIARPGEMAYDSASNGDIMLVSVDGQCVASTADGFHSSTGKPFAWQQVQAQLTKASQYAQLSDQYRCQFSCIDLNGSLFTEVLEMTIWNSYVTYRLHVDQNLSFIDFRLLLASSLIPAKIKSVVVPQLPLPRPKTNSVANQTGPTQHNMAPRAPVSKFHIPTMYSSTGSCVVCRKPTTTQCVNCCDVSGKIVTLCASECFFYFHQDPRAYIGNADDQLELLQAIQQKNTDDSQYNFNVNELEQYDDVWNDEQFRRRPGRPKGARNRRTMIQQALNDPMMPNDFDYEDEMI